MHITVKIFVHQIAELSLSDKNQLINFSRAMWRLTQTPSAKDKNQLLHSSAMETLGLVVLFACVVQGENVSMNGINDNLYILFVTLTMP